jgi:hypothetical protein
MKFFFDNCISPRLAAAFHELLKPDHEVVALRQKFSQACSDVVWINGLASEGGWIIVSGDLRIKKRPQEVAVWKAARLTTFFMADGFPQLPDWEQVGWMVEKWPEIVELAERVAPGAVFKVPKRGKIQQV